MPGPADVLGFVPGEHGRLADWDEMSAYGEALSAASPRVAHLALGRSSGGRPLFALAFGRPEHVRNLEALASRQAARAAGTGGGTAAPPVIVLISCGVHAAEAASAQGAVRLAHALASTASPRLEAVLDRLIVLLLPALDPDGLQASVAWLRSGPARPAAPPSPLSRHPGHDINRDWIMQTQPEVAAAAAGLYLRFLPHVTLDLHEMWPHGPRMFLPPYAPPADPAADASAAARAGALGAAMAARMRARRFRGIVTGQVFDSYSPARSFPHYHGGVRILCETATWDAGAAGREAAESLWRSGSRWPAGPWTFADVLRYQRAAVRACLELVAADAAGWDAWQLEVLARASGPGRPGWYHLPAAQPDPAAAEELVAVLRAGGLSVQAAPDGGAAVPRAQPCGTWADALLAAHPYPPAAGRRSVLPYDVTAHLLPAMMGVACAVSDGPLPDPGPAPSFGGAADGQRGIWPAADTASYARALRALEAGEPVWAAEGPGFPAAFVHAPSARVLPAAVRSEARRLGPPRVGVYGSWLPGGDGGWLRQVLERFGVSHTVLRDADLRGAGPGGCSHVVLPSLRPRDLAGGLPPSRYPPPYAGGLGAEGAAQLAAWTAAGGRLLAVEWAAAWARDVLGLPGTETGAAPAVSSHGALLAVAPQPHPAAFGAPARTWVVYRGGPAPSGGAAAARFTGEPPAAGLAAHAEVLRGAAAVADFAVGAGRCLTYAFSPYFRAQAWASFRWLFAALLL